VRVVGFEEAGVEVTFVGVACVEDVACEDEPSVMTWDDVAIVDMHEETMCVGTEESVKGNDVKEMEMLVIVVASKCLDRVRMVTDEELSAH